MGEVERRRVLRGVAAAGLAAPLIAACGSDEEPDEQGNGGSDSGRSDDNGDDDNGTDDGDTEDGGADDGDDADGESGVTALGPASEVEVGGRRVYETEEVIVTQPAEGEFKAFTARCTHNNCIIQDFLDGDLECPCHNSRFDIETGEPVAGPNGTSPDTITALHEYPVSVDEGGTIYVEI